MSAGNESPRSAKDVIDDAIRENSTVTWLMYIFAISFVLVGLGVMVVGVINQNDISTFLGVAASSLCWPSMTATRRIRKENIAIRLLEAPLSRADTAKNASEMLHKLLNEIMVDGRSDGK